MPPHLLIHLLDLDGLLLLAGAFPLHDGFRFFLRVDSRIRRVNEGDHPLPDRFKPVKGQGVAARRA
jgi:hypothetical protein